MNSTLANALAAVLMAAPAQAANLVASYEFNDTFAASQPGVASLVPVDPLDQSYFDNTLVFGRPDTMYRFLGNADPALQQSGLLLNTRGMVPANDYSIEMIFGLDDTSGWRRILGVSDRMTDNGLYVYNGHFQVYPDTGVGPVAFADDVFHHVVITVAPSGTVKAYIDGLTDVTSVSNVMNITSTEDMMDFFLDNAAGDFAPNEYSSGAIARLGVYSGVLTDAEVLALYRSASVPEPASISLCGLIAALLRRRR